MCILFHKGQCLGILLYRRHYAMLIFIIIPILDMVTGEIEVGEHAHRYEEGSCFIIGVQYDLCCAIANVDDIADETLLFAINNFDLMSNLDCVLGEL